MVLRFRIPARCKHSLAERRGKDAAGAGDAFNGVLNAGAGAGQRCVVIIMPPLSLLAVEQVGASSMPSAALAGFTSNAPI